MRPVTPSHVERDGDATKFLLTLEDGLQAESVLLRIEGLRRTRTTLCVSSQIGCALGCTFCETAMMGLHRNLDSEEILDQWRAATGALGATVDNVVFMGMGEPTENLDAVIPAVEFLADQARGGVAARRISISTVGRIEGMHRLAGLARRDGFKRLSLAVSVNAPNDEIRRSIMPIARSVTMDALRDAMLAWPRCDRGGVLVEYVLIPGVNDAATHARQIAAWLAPVGCGLNVIPYNPRADSPWPAPSEASITRFVDAAKKAGQFTTRRVTLGRAASAACGQLGNLNLSRRRVALNVSGLP